MPVAGAAHSIKTGLKSLRWTPDCANIVCTDPLAATVDRLSNLTAPRPTPA